MCTNDVRYMTMVVALNLKQSFLLHVNRENGTEEEVAGFLC